MLESTAIAKSIQFTTSFRNIQNRKVWIDSTHTNRVLVNLVSNAIKYTPNGGNVSVTAEQTGSVTDGIATYRISVSDTGIGMSEEFISHMFEAFSRERTSTVSKLQGTGLGLTIVKRITESMGGTIEATSTVGKGSSFILTLPLRIETQSEIEMHIASEAKKQEILTESAESILPGKSVLLVEDNELNREIATDLLEEYGLTVTAAEDGLIAVNLIRERSRNERIQDCFDFILMDIQMPVMDGFSASKAIREMEAGTDSHAIIIAMTANAFAEDRAKAIACGMDEHLAKPVNVDKLTEMLVSISKNNRRK